MGTDLDIPAPSDGMPVACDRIKPMDLCGSQYPASHEETMRSLCAPVAVATNKSSLVRVRGWDVLIALLIWSFAPRQHLINTLGRREKVYGPAELERLSLSFLKAGKLSFREVTGLVRHLFALTHITGYKFSPRESMLSKHLLMCFSR